MLKAMEPKAEKALTMFCIKNMNYLNLQMGAITVYYFPLGIAIKKLCNRVCCIRFHRDL